LVGLSPALFNFLYLHWLEYSGIERKKGKGTSEVIDNYRFTSDEISYTFGIINHVLPIFQQLFDANREQFLPK
jgi:hypothetical protein